MTRGRVRRRLAEAALAQVPPDAGDAALVCSLCDRPIGSKVEWHHAVPKSEGGRETVPVHPICHRTIHAAAGNADLARLVAGAGGGLEAVRALEPVARFIRWVADKPPDFHAPTRRRRERG